MDSITKYLRTAKILTIVTLAIVILIVVLQNTEAVETKVLFMSITMPRAALLSGTLIAGFVIGLLCATRIRTRSKES